MLNKKPADSALGNTPPPQDNNELGTNRKHTVKGAFRSRARSALTLTTALLLISGVTASSLAPAQATTSKSEQSAEAPSSPLTAEHQSTASPTFEAVDPAEPSTNSSSTELPSPSAVPTETIPSAEVFPTASEESDSTDTTHEASEEPSESKEDHTSSLLDADPRDAAAFRPICQPGNIYGVTATGQIRAVSPTGSVSNFGSPLNPPSGAFNGLGIGANGSSVYAYLRDSSSRAGTVYSFDVNTGTWISTRAYFDSAAQARPADLVAGAVDLKTGRFFMGGFTPSGASPRYFQVWEYNPASNAVTYKGRLNTDTLSSDQANGDMAFDAKGDLFVLRGNGTTTTVFSVTAADLAAATGGVIASTASNKFTTMNNINGVAFDADGKAYLGSAQELRRYSMPSWTYEATLTSTLGNSTDLASCGSPPTITIEKYVEGGRVASGDQFNLSLRQTSTTGPLIGSTTTTGTANGLQPDRIGPLPTVRNVELHFSETGAGTTSLSNYASSYRCLVDGVQTVQGNGTTGKITIPSTGNSVECRIYNSPLIAQVNITKQVADSQGKNRKPGQNWTVGATAQATTGTITPTPAGSTQQTNASGTASWRYQFGASTHRANLTVREVMQSGYRFDNGKCEVTKLDGTKSTTQLTGPDSNPNVAIVPGDVVDCTLVNTLKPATVSIDKQLQDFTGKNPRPAQGWTVGAVLASGSTSGVDISTPKTALTGPAGKVEKPWTVHFPNNPAALGNITISEVQQEGYKFVSALCTVTAEDGSISEQRLNAESSTLTGLKPADSASCSFTNKPLSGALTWQKVDEAGADLSGSQWNLTGPSGFNGGEPLAIDDCDTETAEQCQDADRDPQAGKFRITDLPWGNYTLEETKAPAGYYPIDRPLKFEITATTRSIELGSIENIRREGPAIPLTGGLGRDFFALLGGGIIVIGLLTAVVIKLRKRHRGVA